MDICPQSTSHNLFELTAFNASFQISTRNFFQGVISLFPPKPEVGHPAWSLPGAHQLQLLPLHKLAQKAWSRNLTLLLSLLGEA